MVDAQMKRGFLEACVLSTLCRKESYGYQIVGTSPDILGLTESTLYPLVKAPRNRWIHLRSGG